jgi:hypothetical protein
MKSSILRLGIATVTGAIVSLVGARAWADQPQRTPSGCLVPPQPTTAPSKDAVQEARTRFARGAQFYNDGDYKLALIEFQRAYDLAPNYRVLYNIGQVNMQLNNYAKALCALESYLTLGGKEIQAQRKTAVENDINSLKVRTARLLVNTNVEGAEILVDDNAIGTTPMQTPAIIDAGQHHVVARKEGKTPANKDVTLAGADDVKLDLELTDLPVAIPVPVPVPQPSGGRERPVEGEQPPPSRGPVWIGWTATGAFAVGAAVTGVLALGAQKDLTRLRDDPNATRQSLDDTKSKAQTLGIVTDVLIGAAVVSGAVSLYFTLKKPSSASASTTASAPLSVGVGPTDIRLQGTF